MKRSLKKSPIFGGGYRRISLVLVQRHATADVKGTVTFSGDPPSGGPRYPT